MIQLYQMFDDFVRLFIICTVSEPLLRQHVITFAYFTLLNSQFVFFELKFTVLLHYVYNQSTINSIVITIILVYLSLFRFVAECIFQVSKSSNYPKYTWSLWRLFVRCMPVHGSVTNESILNNAWPSC